jgi:hypothetical protein
MIAFNGFPQSLYEMAERDRYRTTIPKSSSGKSGNATHPNLFA